MKTRVGTLDGGIPVTHMSVAAGIIDLLVEAGRQISSARGRPLVITVHVDKHLHFTRSGADLSMELPLTLGDALLGAEVTVPALSGKKLLLTIPPATQPGRVFRLGGQGLPRFGKDSFGDLRVRTSIVLPAALDDEATEKAQALIDHVDQPDPRIDADTVGRVRLPASATFSPGEAAKATPEVNQFRPRALTHPISHQGVAMQGQLSAADTRSTISPGSVRRPASPVR